jgi:hypothetical protein
VNNSSPGLELLRKFILELASTEKESDRKSTIYRMQTITKISYNLASIFLAREPRTAGELLTSGTLSAGLVRVNERERREEGPLGPRSAESAPKL